MQTAKHYKNRTEKYLPSRVTLTTESGKNSAITLSCACELFQVLRACDNI